MMYGGDDRDCNASVEKCEPMDCKPMSEISELCEILVSRLEELKYNIDDLNDALAPILSDQECII